MTPEELTKIKDEVEHLDETYWNGSDRDFTDAINTFADLAESARMDWMNGRTPR